MIKKDKKNNLSLKDVFLRLSSFAFENKIYVFLGLFAMVVYSSITAFFPWAVKEIIDELSKENNTISLNSYLLFSGLLLLLFLIRGIAFFYQSMIMSALGQKLTRNLRNSLFNKIINLPFNLINHHKTGDLIGRFTNDINYVEQGFIQGMIGPIRNLTQIILLLAYLAYINIKLFLLTISLLLPAQYIIKYFGKKNKKLAEIKQSKLGFLVGMLNEVLNGLRTVKAYSMEVYEKRRFFRENTKLLIQFIKTIRIGSLSSPIIEFLVVMYIVVILAYGSILINRNEITNGEFVSFILAFFLISAPLRSFNSLFLLMQEATVSANRIYNIIDTPDNIVDEKKKPNLHPIQNKIDININNFSYDTKVILRNINISIKRGEVIALVGRSGSGKTTLVNLIPRFYEIDERQGNILFDNKNIQNYSVFSLRKQIAIVSQDALLFNDTIRHNVSYGKMNQPLSKIIEVCKQSYAHDFITKLDKGYDQIVGEKGVFLSGGQKQRISIARAILKDSPILILDEATNSLDSESEKAVTDALLTLKEGRTTIIIAHKLSTIKNVDRIFVLKDGTIVEKGNFYDLISKQGEFFTLYKTAKDEFIN